MLQLCLHFVLVYTCWPFNSLNFNFVLSLFEAYIRSNQIMGWGEKAIEIRSVETGHLDGVFMHKRAQRLKFLCERNDKVRDCCDTTDNRPRQSNR